MKKSITVTYCHILGQYLNMSEAMDLLAEMGVKGNIRAADV